MNGAMTAWTAEELERLGNEDELQLSSERDDGSLRDAVIMWMGRLGDDIYVRSVKGRSGPCFRGTQTRRRGRISSAGVEHDVKFEDADRTLDGAIDAEYRRKYANEPQEWVDPVLTDQAQGSTIRLAPS
jgi:hypothetical protein